MGGRAPFEALESRLVLSASPAAVIPPMPNLSVMSASVLLLESEVAGGASADSPLLFAPVEVDPASGLVQGPRPRVGPLVALVDPGSSGYWTTPMGGVIAVMSTDTGSLGEDGMPASVVATPMGYPPAPSRGASDAPIPGSGAEGVPVSAAVVGGSSPASTTPIDPAGGHSWGRGEASGLTWPPTPPATPVPAAGSSTALASAWAPTEVPDAGHVEVDGSVDTHGYQTVAIPIGPTTFALGLSLHGGPGGDPAQRPVFGQMSVVDRNGATLAQLGTLWDSRDSQPTAAFTLSLKGLLAGDSLLVQVAMPSKSAAGGSPTSPSSSPVASSAGSGALPFVMDVQRLESPATAASEAMGAPAGSIAGAGELMIGALVGGGDRQATARPGVGASATPESPAAVVTVVVDPGEPAPTTDESTTDEMPELGYGERVATGPLAARAAAPLGPDLSTVMLDATPAIDRRERALAQEIAARAADEARGARDPSTAPGELGAASLDRGGAGESGEADPLGGAILAAAGLGPMPLKVPGSRPGVRGDELGALYAALAEAAGRGDSPDDGSNPGDPLLVTFAPPGASDGDRRSTPDYLTSACIIAVGMGLVTGPIIPDLLRLLPSRSSRWHAAAAGGTGPRRAGVGPGRAGFATWLRRRFGP